MNSDNLLNRTYNNQNIPHILFEAENHTTPNELSYRKLKEGNSAILSLPLNNNKNSKKFTKKENSDQSLYNTSKKKKDENNISNQNTNCFGNESNIIGEEVINRAIANNSNNNNNVYNHKLNKININKENLNNVTDEPNINNDSETEGSFYINRPKFELENIYRERLKCLYKNKTKEELLYFFIESEVKNILLQRKIASDKLSITKLEHNIIDLEQDNIILKNKIAYLLNNQAEISMNNKNNSKNELVTNESDDNLQLPNSSFVERELNIKTEFKNLDIDALLINNNSS